MAGLFALASRPCERHILTTLGEGSSRRGSDGRGVGGGGGVCVEVETMSGGGWHDEQLKELCALHVHDNVQLVYLKV